MPMTAEQLAGIIDQQWNEACAQSHAINAPIIGRALVKSKALSEIVALVTKGRPAVDEMAIRAIVCGLLLGIHTGRAIREIEELEGLGR